MAGTASLILFVLAGAYLFLYQCHYTAYLAARTDGQQLIFRVGAVAALFIILSRVLLLLGERYLPEPARASVERWWNTVFAAFEVSDLPVYVTAFVLGPFLAALFNLVYSRRRAALSTIRRYGTENEKLLVGAMDDQDLVLVTLDSRKVYIGWPVYSPEPRIEGKDFRILPVLSGYRDETELRLVLTTQYITTYERLKTSDVEDLNVDDFETIIPLEEVVSTGLFSLDVDQAWFSMDELSAEDEAED